MRSYLFQENLLPCDAVLRELAAAHVARGGTCSVVNDEENLLAPCSIKRVHVPCSASSVVGPIPPEKVPVSFYLRRF